MAFLRNKHPHHSENESLAEAREVEAAENAASIVAIPESELPDPAVRAALVRLAESGADCYAYTPAASNEHVIWLRPRYRWQDGRLTCAQATAAFHAGTLDMFMGVDIPGMPSGTVPDGIVRLAARLDTVLPLPDDDNDGDGGPDGGAA